MRLPVPLMNLLLDTHALIWVFDANPKLLQVAREAISEGQNEVFVSAVTAWEIVIKCSLGKLELSGNYQRGLERYRFTPLSISTDHALAVETLPQHHADPFDRLLIVQAQLEGLTLVTRDGRFGAYDVTTLPA